MTLERWWLLFLTVAVFLPTTPDRWSWTTFLGSIGVVACVGVAFWQAVDRLREEGK